MMLARDRRAAGAAALLGSVILALPAYGVSAERATLTRFLDPVVVTPEASWSLPDRNTARLRLYAAHGGSLDPIPFQFDAFERNHDLVVVGGEAPQEFEFDEDDELVFMAKDAGDRLAPGFTPPSADAALEIEIHDPVTEERAWAYLLHFRGEPPPRSLTVYAHYDVSTDVARGTSYVIEYFPGLNFFTGMRFISDSGTVGRNMLHRLKIRLNPTFKGGWSPVFKEDDFTAKVEGVKNGPVRAIRRVRQELQLGRFLPDPGGTVHTYYYFSHFVTPSRMSFPWLVVRALRGLRFTGVSDFNFEVKGMTYWDAVHPHGLRLTGRGQTPVNSTTDHDWWALGGPAGSCVHVFLLPEEFTDAGIVRGTVFEDDDTAVDPEDSDPVVGVHSIGYSLLGVVEARRSGSVDTTLATVFLPGEFRPGDEVSSLTLMKRELETVVTPVRLR